MVMRHESLGEELTEVAESDDGDLERGGDGIRVGVGVGVGFGKGNREMG